METDKVFAGAVPQVYDRDLGPILFQPFAEAVAERLGDADRGATIINLSLGGADDSQVLRAYRALNEEPLSRTGEG